MSCLSSSYVIPFLLLIFLFLLKQPYRFYIYQDLFFKLFALFFVSNPARLMLIL